MEKQIDDKDKKILDILINNAEFTTRQISKKTLLPITTVHNRIRKLKKDKVIKKFTIDLDHDKVGTGFMAYVLVTANLKYLRDKKKTLHDLRHDLEKFPFVTTCRNVTGICDIVCILRVKDVKEFDKLMIDKFVMTEGVDKTQTLTVIH